MRADLSLPDLWAQGDCFNLLSHLQQHGRTNEIRCIFGELHILRLQPVKRVFPAEQTNLRSHDAGSTCSLQPKRERYQDPVIVQNPNSGYPYPNGKLNYSSLETMYKPTCATMTSL